MAAAALVILTGCQSAAVQSDDSAERARLAKAEQVTEARRNVVAVEYGDPHDPKRRREKFVKDHPDLQKRDAERILAGEIWIGMPETYARASRGGPNRINRTTTKRGITEQWVYGTTPSTFLYFDDGVLTTFQEPR